MCLVLPILRLTAPQGLITGLLQTVPSFYCRTSAKPTFLFWNEQQRYKKCIGMWHCGTVATMPFCYHHRWFGVMSQHCHGKVVAIFGFHLYLFCFHTNSKSKKYSVKSV